MDFVLVHGAYHGPWCWSLLEPELTKRGHSVVSVELPVSDPDAGGVEYRDAVIAQIDHLQAPVLVGHSMAGAVVPLVAEVKPVSKMVFLCAFLPEPGRSLNEVRKAEPIETYAPVSAEFEDLGDHVWMIGRSSAGEIFYQDLDDTLVEWAYRQLRPQAYLVFAEVTPLQAWPDVPSAYILCTEDRALDPAWSREAARRRLGVEAIELPGGHSPFLGHPVELAEALEKAVG